MKRATPAYYACLTLLGSSVAFAAPNNAAESQEQTLSRRVTYSDLNLGHEPGAAALYTRLKAAAYAVCPNERDWADRWIERAETCRFQALARAIAEVNAPLLTSYYEAKSRTR